MRKQIFVVFIIVIYLNLIAMADEIWLDNGEIIKGTIVEESGQSITIRGEDWWREIDRDRISTIKRDNIKQNDKEMPIQNEIATMEYKSDLENELQRLGNGRTSTGVILTILGVTSLGVGIFVKFGDEELTITSTKINYDEKTYNTLNYLLMAFGGISTIFGIVNFSVPSQYEKEIKAELLRVDF